MSAHPAVPARALAVWCPDWPVVAVGADPDTAAAVVVRGLIVACSSAARAEGVRRGQRTRDAQRLAPELVLYARDEAAEARGFEPVLNVLADFTPRFEVVRPGLAALPVDGPARYFGGEDLVVRAIRDRIGEVGIGAGVGVADGVFAAALAARTDTQVVPGRTAEFLAGFPTTVLELPELVEPLSRLGVSTLGRLAELPADAVTGRFGADGVAAHRLARGLDARPPAPLRQGPDLAVETVFEPPVDGSERIVFAAKALADELHTVLAQAGVACVRVAVEIHGAAGPGAESEASPVSYRLWRHEGLLTSTAVAERVRWQLSGWQVKLRADSQSAGAKTAADRLAQTRGLGPGRIRPGGRPAADTAAADTTAAGTTAGHAVASHAAGHAAHAAAGHAAYTAAIDTDATAAAAEAATEEAAAEAAAATEAATAEAAAATAAATEAATAEAAAATAAATEAATEAAAEAEAAAAAHTQAETPTADQGITRLRLIPDHLVPARGVQPGLWGADEAPDRIARAAERLQAMYGPHAVTLPADAGGRSPADQGVRTAYGDLPPSATDAFDAPGAAPWPGALPAPAPADVPREPRPAEVTDRDGAPVGVSGRLRVTAGPALLALPETRERLRILSWAGPWPLAERWWEPAAAVRRARFQAVTDDGRAWLLTVRDGRWFVEAVYD